MLSATRSRAALGACATVQRTVCVRPVAGAAAAAARAAGAGLAAAALPQLALAPQQVQRGPVQLDVLAAVAAGRGLQGGGGGRGMGGCVAGMHTQTCACAQADNAACTRAHAPHTHAGTRMRARPQLNAGKPGKGGDRGQATATNRRGWGRGGGTYRRLWRELEAVEHGGRVLCRHTAQGRAGRVGREGGRKTIEPFVPGIGSMSRGYQAARAAMRAHSCLNRRTQAHHEGAITQPS
jgi:hypothetical protein